MGTLFDCGCRGGYRLGTFVLNLLLTNTVSRIKGVN